MNLTACRSLPRYPVNGTVYRAMPLPHMATALHSAHTRGTRSRFNPGPLLPPPDQFETLYLAGDPAVAPFELGAMLGHPWNPANTAPHPTMPAFLTVSINVVLYDVSDL